MRSRGKCNSESSIYSDLEPVCRAVLVRLLNSSSRQADLSRIGLLLTNCNDLHTDSVIRYGLQCLHSIPFLFVRWHEK
jgi:hypothetical protein